MFFPVDIKIKGEHLSPTFTIIGLLMSINFYALSQIVKKLAVPPQFAKNLSEKSKRFSIFLWFCVKILCIALMIVFLQVYPNSSAIGAVLGVSVIPVVIVLKSLGSLINPNQTS